MINDLINLYLSFLKVGSLSFGGAYSLIPVIEREIVTSHAWLSQDEFFRVLGMVEILPGAISIKYATYTGFKVAGIPGVIAANLGNMTMPVILIMLAYYAYSYFEKYKLVVISLNGIKFAVLGMILAIVYQYILKNFSDWKSFIYLGTGFSLTLFLKLHPIFIVLVSAALAVILSFI